MWTSAKPTRLLLISALVLGLSAVVLAVETPDPEQVKQFKETGSCKNCDLRDEVIGFVNAEGGDLTNSDLRGAFLYKSLLKDADLTGALLAFTDLRGANLRGAKGANLEGAITSEFTTCPDGAAGPCK